MTAVQDSFSSEEVWKLIAAPVAPSAIAWRQDGRPTVRDGRHFARFVCYIEANTVRERLDSVVPGQWDLTLELLPALPDSSDSDSVCAFKARLEVFGVIREDVGVGKDYKQASTDAFKRAAVRFGIGHELYDYEQNWVEVDGDGKYAKPFVDPGEAYERRHGRSPEIREREGGPAKLSQPADPHAPYGGGGDEQPPSAEERSGFDGRATTPAGLTDVDSVSCPKCGGRMWDNRLTKRNPKAPDYKCRDRGCDGVLWPEKNPLPDPRPGDEPPHPADTDELPF